MQSNFTAELYVNTAQKKGCEAPPILQYDDSMPNAISRDRFCIYALHYLGTAVLNSQPPQFRIHSLILLLKGRNKTLDLLAFCARARYLSDI